MHDVDKIMAMLDWNESIETQQQGIELAKNINSINVFIQPLHQGCSKNVWDNCAIILADKSDEVLSPYSINLLEWIEDINWPGAMTILERLKQFSDVEMLSFAVVECAKRAKAVDGETWLISIAELLNNEKLKAAIPADILAVLQQ